MKEFFKTHTVKYNTVAERQEVRRVVRSFYPNDDFQYWGDKWEPTEFPYMDYDWISHEWCMRRSGANVHRNDMERIPKTVVSPSEFLEMFDFESSNEELCKDLVEELI